MASAIFILVMGEGLGVFAQAVKKPDEKDLILKDRVKVINSIQGKNFTFKGRTKSFKSGSAPGHLYKEGGPQITSI